jgi:hypothetical protein
MNDEFIFRLEALLLATKTSDQGTCRLGQYDTYLAPALKIYNFAFWYLFDRGNIRTLADHRSRHEIKEGVERGGLLDK